MPAERSRGSRRTGADGNQLVWTEPSLAPGISFATNLTPGAFEESTDFTTTFELEPSTPVEPKPEPSTPGPAFFFFDAPAPNESKPKRASHKRKATPPPASPSSPSSPAAAPTNAAASPPAPHIPRPAQRLHPLPQLPSHASLSTIAGLTWSALPAPEKALWHAKAKEEREKHRERFPTYAFRPRHRTTSAPTPPNTSDADDDGSGAGGGGGGGGNSAVPRRRQQREVPPADRARQAHIASLLLTGLSGGALHEAIGRFDAERKQRGEGGVEVRFGVVETPEGRVAADDACERAAAEKREGGPVVRRSTCRGEKRRPSVKTEKKSTDGKRQRLTTSSSLPTSPASSSPCTPIDTTSPFSFAFDALSIPSTPVDDFSGAFDWPYSASTSSSYPPSPACFSPFDLPASPSTTFDSSYPPSPALSHSSASPASSSWSSVEDLSMSLSLPSHTVGPSPLSACSSMSSLGGDLGDLTSLSAPSSDCSIGTMGIDLSSMYGALLPPYDLGLGLGPDNSMEFFTGFLEAPQADGIAAW
ncbi:hypothetical protein B0H14DRAFT_3733015 [Mycena olivaceomarginata]|nr:hypothetical protein B0H14DRAFT_3733015 [Mycena olivaceomarginata]